MPGDAVVAQPQEERPIGFLALMQNRNYALLWSGQFISEIGNRLHWLGVSLWVFYLTQSPAAVSMAISSMFVGGLLVSFWAGPLVDRWNRRQILIVCDLVRAGLVALIPWLMTMSLWLVYLDLALISIATAFFRPAILAILPQLVPKHHIMPANSFFNAMGTGTEILGPVIAGVMAQAVGYGPLLYTDAATYLISATLILGIIAPQSKLSSEGRLNLRALWDEAIEGVRYLRSDRLQLALFTLIFPATLVGSGLNALQTPLAKGVVGISDAEFGVFDGVWGAGFLVGSLLLGWFGVRLRRSLIMLSGFLMAFISTAFMGMSSTFESLLVTAFLVGFANTMYFVATTTILMEYTPGPIFGRVLSLRQIAISLVRVLSPLILGGVAEAVGVRGAIVGMALVGTLATGFVAVRNSIVWRFDAQGSGGPEVLERVWNALTGPTNPSFDPVQQRRLSSLVLVIVGFTWVGLIYRSPLTAAGSIAMVGVLLALGRVAKRVGR